MASLFPTTIDNFANNTDDVDTVVAQDVNDLNDAVEALETKVGIDNSAVSTSIDYILKNKIWPIGSVFTAVVATSPATLLGFGTWSQIAGGRVLVGQTDGDADFNVAEKTGGAKSVTLTAAESGVPAHLHAQTGKYSTTSTHGHSGVGGGAAEAPSDSSGTATNMGNTGNNATANASSAHTNLQPYLVVYFWKRIA